MKFYFALIILAELCFYSIRCEAKQTPIVIAHRGASGYLPEHTLEAKTAAIVMGSDYIEQDLVLTKDNVPIVVHDIYLDEVSDVAKVFPDRYRTARNGKRRYYAVDFTLDEIRMLKANERFNYDNGKQIFDRRFPLNKSTFTIHSFEEEIELLQGMQKSFQSIYSLQKEMSFKKVGLYVEIKRPDFHVANGRTNFSEIVLAILAKYNYTKRSDPVFIQCFDPIELR